MHVGRTGSCIPAKDDELGLYIFDPDSFYDYDIVSEISSVWPLKFKI